MVLKVRALRTADERYNDMARFWARIFGLNFAMGVVTGIPMEFQFGTNWARFSQFAGGVIGQSLALEGVFAFILESAFLGLFLFCEKRLGPDGLRGYRAGLGRQRGLAARRGRRGFPGVPAVLRGRLQRLLPGLDC